MLGSRLVVLCISLALASTAAGCEDKPLRTTPLPTLQQRDARRPERFPPTERLVIAGEHLTWEVRWHGLAIGRAEYAVAPAPAPGSVSRIAVRSRFRTTGAARKVEPLSHDLRADVVFGPAVPAARDPVHNLHSALAALRGWARPGAPPGKLFVLHEGRRYRVDIGSPKLEELPRAGEHRDAIRVDCRALRTGRHASARYTPTYITLWLSPDRARVPLRIDAEDDGFRVHASLVEREVVRPR